MKTVDKILKLEQELEDLRNDLACNRDEQSDLRRVERTLLALIDEKEEELENLERVD